MPSCSSFQITQNDSLTLKIVEEIAERKGVDPLELNPPLQTVVDIATMEDRFVPPFRNDAVEERVTFTYCGYRVTLERNEDVQLSVKEV